MAITNAFNEAVEQRNVRKIRIMMGDSLLVDPTFAEFNQMEKLASCVEGLYDQHDGREMNNDKNQWNDEYMNKLLVQVISNFSHERVNHLKDVVHYLRPAKLSNGPVNSTNSENSRNQNISSYAEQKERDMASGNFRPGKVAVGAMVGGGAGALIGAIASPAVLTGAAVFGGAVIGAGVGAGIAYAMTNGDDF